MSDEYGLDPETSMTEADEVEAYYKKKLDVLAARLAEVEAERDNALALAEQLERLLKEARGGAE